jgi:hypothetical protein
MAPAAKLDPPFLARGTGLDPFCRKEKAAPPLDTRFGPWKRPLCADPKVAHYKGGDPSDAASFTCGEP